MPQPDECPPREKVLRGITHHHIKHGKVSSSAFSGTNISVNRLAILSFDKSVAILKRNLSDPERPLSKVGRIGVGQIVELGRAYSHPDGRSDPRHLKVVPVPELDNPAHAEIRGDKISRGLARNILAVVELRDV